MAVVEPAGKHGGRGAPFAHNGEAVLLHQELVDKGAVLCIELVVVAGKLADGKPEALEDGVQIVDKGAKNAGKAEVAGIVACYDMRPVHADKVGHELRIVCDGGQVCPCKALPEIVLVRIGQARQKGLHVLHQRLLLLRRILFASLRQEHVVLERLLEGIELPVKNNHGKAGQLFVLEHGVFKGRQKLARFHHRVGGAFLVGADKAEADVHGVQVVF